MSEWQGTPIEQGIEIGYCTPSNVNNILKETDTNLNLSAEAIQHAIYDASREIDDKTRTIYYTKSHTEIIKPKAKGLILLRRPLLSVETLEYLNNEDWIRIEQGYTKDYFVDELSTGRVVVNVHSTRYRVTYTYGHAEIPDSVKYMCSYLAAYNVLLNKLTNDEAEETILAKKKAIDEIRNKVNERAKTMRISKIGANFL